MTFRFSIFSRGLGALAIVFCGVSVLGQVPEERNNPIFALPNNFDSVKIYHADDSDGMDDYSDLDGQIVQAGGAATVRRYSFSSRTFSWYDAARRRTVPAQVFYPSTKDQRFPVIVFSHGLGGSPSRCSYLASAWASRGFVVVLVQHPGSDENVWKGKVFVRNELREAYKTSWSGRTRALDLRFALDCMESLAANGDWLGSLLDLENVGVGGYDLGSLASLLLAGQLPPDGRGSLADPRIKAVLAMSPPINPPQGSYRNVYGPIDVPAFFITGTDDNGVVGSTKASQRRIPFDSMSGNDRFLVVLQGADHMVFGGHVLSIRARNDQPFQNAISRVSTLFWRAYLKQDEQAQLDVAGYRLNLLLGVAATVERRIVSRSSEARATPVQEAPKPSVEVPTTPMIERSEVPAAAPLLTETFPLTRLYRVMVARSEETEISDRETASRN